jgi:hypothetical protein
MATKVNIDEYSNEQLRILMGKNDAFLAALMAKTAAVPNSITADWPRPNINQLRQLQQLRTKVQSKAVTAPSTILEQTSLKGGETVYSERDGLVSFTSIVPGLESSRWVIDTIPVEEHVYDSHPGIGRCCFFLAATTHVKDGWVVSTMTEKNVEKYEVKILRTSTLPILCSFLNDIIEEMQMVRKEKEGQAGLQWLDKVYFMLRDCPIESFVGMSSLILGDTFFLGKHVVEDGALSLFPTQHFLTVQAEWNALKAPSGAKMIVPRPMRAITGQFRDQMLQNPMLRSRPLLAFWTGDLPPLRQVPGTPSLATRALNVVQAFNANHGGKGGISALMSGRLGVGVLGPTMEKALEFLIVMWGLVEPHNVYGIDMSKVKIWQESLSLFGVENTHRFVLADRHPFTSYYPDKSLPTIRFDYDQSLATIIKINPKDSDEMSNEKLVSAASKWVVDNFTNPADKWVGAMILPFGGIKNDPWFGYDDRIVELFKDVSAHQLGLPYNGRAVFSRCQIFGGYTVPHSEFPSESSRDRTLFPWNPHHSTARPFKYVPSRRILVRHDAVTWGRLIVTSVFSLSGYMVCQPRFKSFSTMRLVPPFKSTDIIINDAGDWEFVLGSGEDIEFHVTGPTTSVYSTTVSSITARTTVSTGGPVPLRELNRVAVQRYDADGVAIPNVNPPTTNVLNSQIPPPAPRPSSGPPQVGPADPAPSDNDLNW